MTDQAEKQCDDKLLVDQKKRAKRERQAEKRRPFLDVHTVLWGFFNLEHHPVATSDYGDWRRDVLLNWEMATAV